MAFIRKEACFTYIYSFSELAYTLFDLLESVTSIYVLRIDIEDLLERPCGLVCTLIQLHLAATQV